MNNYEIILLVAGLHPDDDDAMNRLYSAIEDVIVEDRGTLGVVTLNIQARDAYTATLEAIASIESAVPQSSVRHIDADLVCMTDIADRINQSRESVRLWAKGLRGHGDFPVPIGVVGDTRATRIWAWGDVLRWLVDHHPERVQALPRAVPTPVRTQINAMLQSQRIVTSPPRSISPEHGREVADAAEQEHVYTP
jgi:hypothetical protein